MGEQYETNKTQNKFGDIDFQFNIQIVRSERDLEIKCELSNVLNKFIRIYSGSF